MFQYHYRLRLIFYSFIVSSCRKENTNFQVDDGAVLVGDGASYIGTKNTYSFINAYGDEVQAECDSWNKDILRGKIEHGIFGELGSKMFTNQTLENIAFKLLIG